VYKTTTLQGSTVISTVTSTAPGKLRRLSLLASVLIMNSPHRNDHSNYYVRVHLNYYADRGAEHRLQDVYCSWDNRNERFDCSR